KRAMPARDVIDTGLCSETPPQCPSLPCCLTSHCRPLLTASRYFSGISSARPVGTPLQSTPKASNATAANLMVCTPQKRGPLLDRGKPPHCWLAERGRSESAPQESTGLHYTSNKSAAPQHFSGFFYRW